MKKVGCPPYGLAYDIKIKSRTANFMYLNHKDLLKLIEMFKVMFRNFIMKSLLIYLDIIGAKITNIEDLKIRYPEYDASLEKLKSAKELFAKVKRITTLKGGYYTDSDEEKVNENKKIKPENKDETSDDNSSEKAEKKTSKSVENQDYGSVKSPKSHPSPSKDSWLLKRNLTSNSKVTTFSEAERTSIYLYLNYLDKEKTRNLIVQKMNEIKTLFVNKKNSNEVIQLIDEIIDSKDLNSRDLLLKKLTEMIDQM